MRWANHKAIVATAVLQVVTGAVLMSPAVFLAPWAQAFHLAPETVRPEALPVILGFLTALAYDYLYAWLLSRQQVGTLRDSLMLTVALWVGVILIADFGHLSFARIGWQGIAINAIVRLVNGLWAGWILFRWRPR